MKEENLQIAMDDLDLAHKQAKRRIVKSGLHLDVELKPYLQCIASELAAAFTDGRQHQYKIDRTRLCEDRGGCTLCGDTDHTAELHKHETDPEKEA